MDKLLFTHPFYEFYYITKMRISFLMATLFMQRILACTSLFPLLTLTHFTPSLPNKYKRSEHLYVQSETNSQACHRKKSLLLRLRVFALRDVLRERNSCEYRISYTACILSGCISEIHLERLMFRFKQTSPKWNSN